MLRTSSVCKQNGGNVKMSNQKADTQPHCIGSDAVRSHAEIVVIYSLHIKQIFQSIWTDLLHFASEQVHLREKERNRFRG